MKLYIEILQQKYMSNSIHGCHKISFQVSDISVFEVNIRFIGGLLACYALTGDQVLEFLSLSISISLFKTLQ